RLPEGTLELDPDRASAAQQRWREQLERWRAEAEKLCEARIRLPWSSGRERDTEPGRTPLARAAAVGLRSLEHASPAELDGQVRAIASAMARTSSSSPRSCCGSTARTAGAASALPRKRTSPASGSACPAPHCWAAAR